MLNFSKSDSVSIFIPLYVIKLRKSQNFFYKKLGAGKDAHVTKYLLFLCTVYLSIKKDIS